MDRDTAINGILLIYHYPLNINAPTILQHVEAFSRHSQFKVWSINTQKGFPPGLQSLRFRVVLLHYTLFGFWPYEQLNDQFLRYIAESKDSYLIAFFQDEYRFCKPRFDFVNHFGVDCIYTLLEPNQFDAVYGKYTKAKSLIYTIPGYVSDELVELGKRLTKPDEERNIDIGYRGRRLEHYMGKGAQEKIDIARIFSERSRVLGLTLNIGTEENQRIYSEGWYKFLSDCKGCLGVEAGVSIFDLEDKVRTRCERLLSENPGLSFAELSSKLLDQWEDNVYYRTISPRHFEAAALRVCQILFEGRYSGIMQPMVHYIPLKKDFSNFDEVIRLFRNRDMRHQLTDNAYRDMIASGTYSYRSFIESFDEHLFDKGISSQINKDEAKKVSAVLAKVRIYSYFLTFLKMIRYYPFPGKAYLTDTSLIKPLVEKYRHYRRSRLERDHNIYRKEGNS